MEPSTLEARVRELSPGGAADPERVEALRREALTDPDDGFAERALAGLRGSVERLLAEARHSDFVEAADLIRHARHLLEGLDPRALEPRRGLAGVFDSRGGRLKRFRAQFLAAAASATDTASSLAERGASAARRSASLEALHAEARRIIAEADAAIAAGAGLLKDRVDAAREDAAPAPSVEEGEGRIEAQADAEAAAPDETRTERLPAEDAAAIDPAGSASGAEEDAPSAQSRTERLARLIASLIAARAAGVGQLPLARAVQNAEHAAPEQLSQAAAALTAWVEDWRQGLGLSGRRPKRVRPDSIGLARTRDAALEALQAAETRLAQIRARTSETEVRMARVVEQVRKAA